MVARHGLRPSQEVGDNMFNASQLTVMKKIVNILGRDGNFENDSNVDGRSDGWGTVSNAIYSKGLNSQKFTPSSQNGGIQKEYPITLPYLIPLNIYYSCAIIKSSTGRGTLQLKYGPNAYQASMQLPTASGTFSSIIATVQSGFTQGMLWLLDTGVTGFTEIEVSKVHFINLTKAFGAGNEPTKAQMDVFMQKALTRGYFTECDYHI